MTASMTMVEKVARALAKTAWHRAVSSDDDFVLTLFENEDRYVEHRWRRHQDFARAAIEAMREPTKEMIEAGYQAMDDGVDFYNYDSGAGYTIEPTGGADVLRAMIDAALEEGKEDRK